MLLPDYPDIFEYDLWSWGFWGRTMYSPDMKQVIYPALRESGYEYILWNVVQKEEVASFKEVGHAAQIPKWAPNGKYFSLTYFQQDFMVVDQKGEVLLKTNIREQYPDQTGAAIRSWSWSPDSRKIAFWLDTYTMDSRGLPEEVIDESLMVLDIGTAEITDFCAIGEPMINTIFFRVLEACPSGRRRGTRCLSRAGYLLKKAGCR